jgi:hypothetical protein
MADDSTREETIQRTSVCALYDAPKVLAIICRALRIITAKPVF